MNFLMNYFQASVHASGYEDLIAKVDNAVARYNGIEIQSTQSEEPVTLTQAIAVASQEAVVETAPVEPTTAPKKKLSKKERIALAEAKKLAETAKVIRKEAHKSLNELRGKVSETSTKEEKEDLAKLESFVANLPNLNDVQLVAEVARLDAERQATTVVKF